MADATGEAIVATDSAPIESVSSLAKPGEALGKPTQYVGKAIPSTVKQSVLELVATFLGHNMIARREYVKKCVRNHELFRGNGWGWYDYATGSYRRDFSTQSTGRAGPEQASFVQSLYQLNIFQPFTLSVISLLSSNKMTVKFWPENSRKPQDVEASRKHDLVYRAFARSERHHSQLVKAIYHLWCDGTFGSYVRSVYDADRFGWVDEPIVEHVPQEIGPASWECVVCRAPSQEPGVCQNPECGAPLPTEPNVPPPMATLPKITGYEKTPRGKTVRDIVPGLELVLPPTADDMWEFPYLGRRRVVAKSTIRAAYSEMAKEIGGQSDADMGDSANETLERRAQMQLALGTNVDNRSLPAHQMDHLFYTEFWLRRSAFFQLDDEKRRDELLDLFPDGCYVAFADALVLEVRSEKMDDHWRICHALPGPGQIREPIGGSLVQIQEIINDLVNMVRDTIEFTMPMTFADQDVVDLRQMVRAANAAGMMIPVTRKAGRPVSEAFYQTQPGQIQPFAVTFLNDLRTTWAQFATGAFPAAYGGGTPGNSALDVDTPIPTPNGFVRNGDLKAGDKVFGEDGRVYDVVKAHPIYVGESYRVTFDDGSEVVADGKHRWRTYTRDERDKLFTRSEERRKYIRDRQRTAKGIPLDAPLGVSGAKRKSLPTGAIRTTAEIASTLLDRRGRSNHAIPISIPFEAPTAKLPIDPYVLGAWLGDGSAAGAVIACSDEDGPAMAREFKKAGYDTKKLKSPYTWYAKGLRKKLRLMGLLGEKRIPHEYLWASPKQRLALLQGLMDTDGCATKDGKQFFSNRNRNLIDGVFHLAASLGAKPRILEMTTGVTVDKKTGKVYEGGRPIWVVRWTSPLDAFRLERKAVRLKKTSTAARRSYRYIVSVERIEDRAVRCITVSNPTEGYVCGPAFVHTCNTAQGIEIERNSALGRISLFLRALTEHWLSCAPLVIKDFRENGMEPLTIVDKAPAGDYSTDTVSPEDLEIGNAKTMPELNEEYPVTWPQRQAALLQMFTNPLYQSMLAMISNAGEIKRTLGHELRVPGEDAYEFQSKLIKKLLEQAPVAGPDIPVMDPMTGQPAVDQMGQPMMQPGPMIASIMPQQIEDHPSMLQACIDFYYSDEASQYRDQPGNTGWQNFMLHAGARQQAALEQMQTMPPAQPNVPEIPVPTSTAQPPQATPMMPPGPPGLPGLPMGGPPQMPPAGPPAMMGQALPPGGPLPM